MGGDALELEVLFKGRLFDGRIARRSLGLELTVVKSRKMTKSLIRIFGI